MLQELLLCAGLLPVALAFELPDLAKLLAPAPAVFPTSEYDGFEIRAWKVVFRPALFKREGILLGLIILYAVASQVGKSMNSRRAKKWCENYVLGSLETVADPAFP